MVDAMSLTDNSRSPNAHKISTRLGFPKTLQSSDWL
jgi:hypothetical protein